jgi:hypothetical protein
MPVGVASQVGSFNPSSRQFSIRNLGDCAVHPYVGLSVDTASPTTHLGLVGRGVRKYP